MNDLTIVAHYDIVANTFDPHAGCLTCGPLMTFDSLKIDYFGVAPFAVHSLRSLHSGIAPYSLFILGNLECLLSHIKSSP